eukprot:TRINITY_DN37162_c0_g1_i1.p1 TRINITY_DN37162_c0_g1~~TRINITY_DN37162_c0_g1_i1.p1  ORF type:complete len:137 (-),score=20.48 TRINITY_DN37162_c0_g1_i1:62-472(-)
MATDMAHVELIASSLCDMASLADTPDYLCLRAMRPLLFATEQDMPKDAAGLPPVVALHLILSTVPGIIPMPYTVLGWSHAEYGLWLLAHSGQDVWSLAVWPALQRYRNEADLRQAECCQTYHEICKFGNNAFGAKS